jgi:GNAT superfamily N-acetyltransferase
MEIVIRAAQQRDYDTLCEIIDQVDKLHREKLPGRFKAAAGPVRTKGFVRSAIQAPAIGLLVAEIGGAVVGFVHVIVRDTPEIPIFVQRRYAIVDSLAVRQEHQRSGVGRALMERAHTWARIKGATSIELNVYAFNRAAERFYRKLGYEILSRRMSRSLAPAEHPNEEG